MKKSNNMNNPGSNNHGQKVSKKDIARKQSAYNDKFDEYDKMELDVLVELRDSKTIKGGYLDALNDVIDIKNSPKRKGMSV